ncbi:hypothetical protein ACHAWX_002740 [Stephanocyclus meneghinianus]
MEPSTSDNIITSHEAQHSNRISLPLVSLPLRPSTLASLLRCGFSSTGDVAHALKMSEPPDSNDENDAAVHCHRGENAARIDASHHAESRLDHFADELGCSPSQAADFVCEIDDALDSIGMPKMSASDQRAEESAPSVFGATAASILKSKRSASNPSVATRQIVSFCMPLDHLLGGGIALSELTEIVGLPGSGKTQLAMQLCVDARLPAKHGGVEGCAVVVDSEGSWGGAGIERLWDMAAALVEHVRGSALRRAEAKRAREMEQFGLFKESTTEENLLPPWFTPESILEGIHIFRVHDEAAQTCTLYSLPHFLIEQEEKGKPVKLLVIDSLAFHYRVASSAKKKDTSKTDSLTNTNNLIRMATYLLELASEFELAVVAMNHVTTKIDKDDATGSGVKLVPALGESWAHSVTSRLMIDHYSRVNADASFTEAMEEWRICTLVKSPHKPPGTALFTITDKGIRGAPTQHSELQHRKKSKHSTT